MTNQPKVSTEYYTSEEKKEKIKEVLRGNQQGMTPKQMSSLTRINVNTIKSMLPKIEGVKKKEGYRGYYILVEEDIHSQIFSWNFHNCILSIPVEDYCGNKINKTISSDIINLWFELYSTSKKATFHLSSEFPLNISSLCLISVIVKLALRDYTCSEISNDNITLSSIEFNKDYSNLRLDSANSITLSNYIEQFKIYPKKAGVRYEHKITQPLNAQDVISSLLNQGNALDFSTRLTNLEKEQEKTNSILSKVSKLPSLFNALLERLDKRPI